MERSQPKQGVHSNFTVVSAQSHEAVCGFIPRKAHFKGYYLATRRQGLCSLSKAFWPPGLKSADV